MNILKKLRKPSAILLSLVFFYSCNQERSLLEDEVQQTDLHNVQFHSLKNNEITAITDLDGDGNFKNYYFIQGDRKIDFNSLKNDLYQIKFNDTYLIFKNKKGNIIFSVDDENIDKFKSEENNYFSAVGISKRYTGDSPLNIKTHTLTKNIDCHSGGIGASSCSTESGAPLGGNCSVSCRKTHYACCDDTRNECKCIPSSKS